MAFAPINSDLSYWHKQTQPLFDNLIWNIPEQKTGHVAIVGGNSQNFSSVIRVSEFINQSFPIKTLTTVLPDALRGKLPPLPNLDFLLLLLAAPSLNPLVWSSLAANLMPP